MSQPTYQAHIWLSKPTLRDATIRLSRAEARGIAKLLDAGIYIAGGITLLETIDGQTTHIHNNDLIKEETTHDVNAHDLTRTGTETMIAEASTLGLEPGTWPAKLRIYGLDDLGRQIHDGATYAYDEVDETGAHIYKHDDGSTIVVRND